ncbi:hypothetical protein [Haloplanus halobius]|uniref:hypothetical protein n=1 Tax=Haloplanus halobius TaxID=2934938 RepID=UPI00200DAE7C|nr:hypothetical protein [Haloplanus sp. XH21]
MALPGFVRLGALAVVLQLAVVGVVYAYLRHRHPVADPSVRRRRTRLVLVGSGLAALGQLAALGAVGILRLAPVLSLDAALAVQNVGVLAAALGYIGVIAGFVVHIRAAD